MLLGKKKELVREGTALLEMYKAGFLDAYQVGKRVRSNKDFQELNKKYKKSFNKRFGKKITKELKESKKK